MATDPAAPVVEDTETPTPAQVDVSTLSLGQLDEALARGEAVDDAQLTVMATQAYTQLMAATNNDPAATIDAMQEGGLLNAEIAGKFKTAIEGAGGDAAKFAEEIVKDRESLAQLAMLQATAAAAGAGATATAAVGFDNPEFQAKMMELFAKIFEPILEGLTGEDIDLAGLLGTAQQEQEEPAATGQEQTPEQQGATVVDNSGVNVTDDSAGPPANETANAETDTDVTTDVTAVEETAEVTTSLTANDVTLTNFDFTSPGLLTTADYGFSLTDYSSPGFGTEFDLGTNFDFGLDSDLLALDTDPYGFETSGFNVFQTDYSSPQFQLAGLDANVDLMIGTTTLGGMQPVDRFNSLSLNDPNNFTLSNPQIDTGAGAGFDVSADDELKLTTAAAGLRA